MPDAARRRRRRRARALGTAFVVAVAAVATGVGLVVTSASGVSGYRTAEATSATVRQTMGLSGTVATVHAATADFQVAGSVSSVKVALGDHVRAGQELAALDPSPLEQDVSSARSTLSAAKAQLSEDESAQSSTAASTTASSTTAASTTAQTEGNRGAVVEDAFTTSKPSSGHHAGGSATGSLKQDQAAVVTAQAVADNEAETAAAALADAQKACHVKVTKPTKPKDPTKPKHPKEAGLTAVVSSAATTTTAAPSTTTTTSIATTTTTATTAPSTTTTAPSTTPSTTTTTMPTTTTTTPTSASACATALSRALTDQQELSVDQQAVATAESALATVLSHTSSSPSTGGGATSRGSTPSSTRSGASGGSSRTGANGSGSGSSTTSGGGAAKTAVDSAAQLATDQASIDSARASLVDAEQLCADAELMSPIAGSIASVDLSAGESVTAGSTTDGITIINSGSFEATASLTSTQASEVKVGDKADVTVNGTDGTQVGTVSRVGPVSGSTTTSYTYPVVVALAGAPHGIEAGSRAQIQLVLDQIDYALAIPTSAVHTLAEGESYAMVLRSGHEVRQPITVGAVGSVYTQVKAGIAKGATVVLADLGQALPSSSTNETTGGFGGAGGGAGFGGVGGFGGGAGSGGGGGFTGGGGFARSSAAG